MMQLIKGITISFSCDKCNKFAFRYYALKILSMADVIKLKQVEHVKNEKNILSQVEIYASITIQICQMKVDCDLNDLENIKIAFLSC